MARPHPKHLIGSLRRWPTRRNCSALARRSRPNSDPIGRGSSKKRSSRFSLSWLIVLVAVVGESWSLWAIGALILIWLFLVARGFIRWFTTQHVITTERVIHRMGMVSKQGKEIPLEVINDVAFNQSAWERIFGTGDLLIESAGTHGQSQYTDIPDPEAIQSLIYQVERGPPARPSIGRPVRLRRAPPPSSPRCPGSTTRAS